MRILAISTDWNVFNEDSAVARRQRMQASTVDRLDVFVPHGPRQVVHLAGNATMYGFGPGKLFGALRMLKAAFSFTPPDIVSAQDPFFIGFLAWLIARMQGAKLHIQVHTDVFHPAFVAHGLVNRIKVLFARFLLRRADGIRVVSERIKRSLSGMRVRGVVSVLPVFVDSERIAGVEPLDGKRLYPDFQKIVLVVSRLEPEKGVADAIRAFPRILSAQPGAGLIIVGDGSLREELKALVRELGLKKHVVFAGSHSPFPFYKTADLLLVTSEFEGYGMVIVEALCAGCPVVSYDVGVAKEAGAIIVRPKDLARVAGAVLSEGKRGTLAFILPSEIEYRDMWRSEIASCVALEKEPEAPQSTASQKRPKIGYVGQGFIGKNYADDMENRGYEVIRYALEEPYRHNKEKIRDCDIIFIAVPTPTVPAEASGEGGRHALGFDDSIVRASLGLVAKGKTAVVKSTLLPGSTEKFQKEFSDIFVMHSPEFLREATAAYDASHPDRNIVGIVHDTLEVRMRAEAVLDVLPPAPFQLVCSSLEAEIIKYAGNSWLYLKVVYVNMLYDLAQHLGTDYEKIRDALAADPRIGRSHLDPVHQSGHSLVPGRGAGGHCLIKDFEALRRLYEKEVPDPHGARMFGAVAAKNIDLLLSSGKDLDLLKGVYGEHPERGIDLSHLP